MTPRSRRAQSGSVAVEFAMVGGLFFTVLTAVITFGGVMTAAEAAADATRTAARIAAVCDPGTDRVVSSIQSRLPQLAITAQQVSVVYSPAGCTASTCERVAVGLSGVTYPVWIAFVPANLPLPAFQATLPAESLESRNEDGEANPVCFSS